MNRVDLDNLRSLMDTGSKALSLMDVRDFDSRQTPESIDLESRIRVIGFCRGKYNTDAEIRDIWRRQMRALTQQLPEHPLFGTGALEFNQMEDPDFYEELKQFWVGQVDNKSKSVQMLINAAAMLVVSDPLLARNFLSRAMELEPLNPQIQPLLKRCEIIQAIYDRID